jgi:hypothetical protein
MTPCKCGCGELTGGEWKRGHWARGEGGYDPAEHGPGEQLLPGPGEDTDLGVIDFGDDEDAGPGPARPGTTPAPPPPGPSPGPPPQRGGDDGEIPADPAPGPVNDRTRRGGGGRPGPVRVTANVRKDVEAKLGLMLEIPGRVWAARDPYCGGAFVQSIPEIRPAAAELVCQSPDLVAWFTGTGGGFMLWLNLLTALQPVLYTMWAHHIAHAIEEPGNDQAAPSAAQYAA